MTRWRMIDYRQGQAYDIRHGDADLDRAVVCGVAA